MGYEIFFGILEFHSAPVPGIKTDRSLRQYRKTRGKSDCKINTPNYTPNQFIAGFLLRAKIISLDLVIRQVIDNDIYNDTLKILT